MLSEVRDTTSRTSKVFESVIQDGLETFWVLVPTTDFVWAVLEWFNCALLHQAGTLEFSVDFFF